MRSRARPGYLDSLDDAVDLCFAFNLRAASQHPERASLKEVFLETHLTFDVVCQATVDLRAARTQDVQPPVWRGFVELT